jgi:hypothetical protein
MAVTPSSSSAALWLRLATSREVATGAVLVSSVVGTVLNLINQGDRILAGFEGFDLARGALNYVVPFLVSTWSATRVAVRDRRRREAETWASSPAGGRS